MRYRVSITRVTHYTVTAHDEDEALDFVLGARFSPGAVVEGEQETTDTEVVELEPEQEPDGPPPGDEHARFMQEG